MDLKTVLSMMAISLTITFLFVISYNTIVTTIDKIPKHITRYLMFTILILLVTILLLLLGDQVLPTNAVTAG